MKFNALVPELSVKDIKRSKWFYIEILGFQLEYERADAKFAFLSLNRAQIIIEEINGFWNTGLLEYPFGRGINFQILTDDIQTIAERLIQNEILLFREPTVNEYKSNETVIKKLEFLVQDPDGYLLSFSQQISS
ncbi:VOC family protein [Bacillus sp. DTU_2020_1000418_1_SI_GHA_SEK_038]|uniref:bleomycin resistance protein n=1 Tax=Bacillus sp. DTU_2020_1000418_1_SI_GHA_SEK_038 TaxID=3077585 RepID=UPI0028E641A1|nr:VOC family protein [Bacillus sp. DTU_2020_1000418_1_SI_GHA_SEK_038]WNS76064.1 VOC family protein [Bacillus sp. DTU_2020_1000418_1_SI_GHA_SEK_038]